ncbi:MAG TPA: hypothetical protein DD671_00785 [Balneolaceae bacterium]|nr:hypothetical protein [Balneolaceae bacterium]
MTKIDLSYLAGVTDGDKEIMGEMIDLILEETPIHLQNIVEFMENKEWKRMGAEAHKVKPLFLYVGLTELKDLAQEIAQFGKTEENLDQIPSLIEKLELGFNEIQSKLTDQKELLA